MSGQLWLKVVVEGGPVYQDFFHTLAASSVSSLSSSEMDDITLTLGNDTIYLSYT